MYDDDDEADVGMLYDRSESRSGEPFYWTPALQDNFREELEKYVMRLSFAVLTDISFCQIGHSWYVADVNERPTRP